MAFDDEKTIDAGAEPGSYTKSETVTNPNIVSDTDSTQLEKQVEVQNNDDSQYPHGAKLVLLSCAALAAVFLVALDQVRPPFPWTTRTHVMLTALIPRPSSVPQYPRSQTSFTDSRTYPGTRPPTS